MDMIFGCDFFLKVICATSIYRSEIAKYRNMLIDEKFVFDFYWAKTEACDDLDVFG